MHVKKKEQMEKEKKNELPDPAQKQLGALAESLTAYMFVNKILLSLSRD